jgi:hypothetical protein
VGTSDEKILMTRTVCRTMVLFLSLASDQCITRYTDSKSDQDENHKMIVDERDALRHIGIVRQKVRVTGAVVHQVQVQYRKTCRDMTTRI